jgi:hypothetical protein
MKPSFEAYKVMTDEELFAVSEVSVAIAGEYARQAIEPNKV